MRKFRFEKTGAPIPTYRILKFVIGWHLCGVCFYELAWKPKVRKKTEAAGYDWDKLSSTQKLTQFLGMDLGKVKVKRVTLFGETVEEQIASKSDNITPMAGSRPNNVALCATKEVTPDGKKPVVDISLPAADITPPAADITPPAADITPPAANITPPTNS